MITTVVLIVETYAWFVGITTVNVSNFDIQVSSSEGLELSLDGENWKSGSRTLTISQDSLTLTLVTGDQYSNDNYTCGGGNTCAAESVYMMIIQMDYLRIILHISHLHLEIVMMLFLKTLT